MIDTFRQRHERVLHDILENALIQSPRIREAMRYSLLSGGKRLRPTLVYLAGAMLDTEIQILDTIAAAMELTHCYSLIHDDLPAMDDDDMRRGIASCHKAFDEATAILVGDGMQALAIEVLLTRLGPLVPPEHIVSITQCLVHASGISGMVSGQSLDLSELARASVDEDTLRTIHLLKTGKLIMACFEMVLAAHHNVSPELQQALRTYAEHIGLVFQMQDDYLDRYAPVHHLGKGRASDSANQKTTFATLYTKQDLERLITTYYQSALEALTPFETKALPLIELTHQLHKRSLLY